MTATTIIMLVFAILGAVSTALTALGAALPATSTVGVWCRKIGVDVKWLLGFSKEIEAVVPVISGATGVAGVVSVVESVVSQVK